jgi:hypothetical protein
MLSIGPEAGAMLKQIVSGIAGMNGAPGAGKPVDKNSPEYKQAVMQQLAAGTPMGAIGSALSTANGAYLKNQQKQADMAAQKQTDMNAWMPVVTKGE